MKLSFSTLTCPEWTFREIFAAASDLGFDGIEIRGIADEMYAPLIKVFADDKIEDTKEQLAKRNLEIPILTSGAYILGNPNIEAAGKEVEEYSILAQKLGVKYVRVLIEETPAPTHKNPDMAQCASIYAEMCSKAAKYGITLLTETNGFLADTKKCRKFMEMTDAPNMGLIWDVHHPYRYFGESPFQTLFDIGSYVKHVHIKDSVIGTNGQITYMLNGYGDIPFGDIIECLKSIGYEAYLSYEWVKRWSRELAEPSITLYSYISHMKSLL